MGRGIVFNLTEFGFQGIIYQVGPKGGAFAGRRIYKSVLDIPDHVDLAVILTPARTVPGILEECGQKGIQRVVIESAGFREYGEEGKKIEEEIIRVAEKWNMRFVGPNCNGIMSPWNKQHIQFPAFFVPPGPIAIIAQSGNVLDALSLQTMISSACRGIPERPIRTDSAPSFITPSVTNE
jgi:acetyltransferase